MKYLLDTHAFLFWMLDSPELPSRSRSVIEEYRDQVTFSVLSAWEIAIKTSLESCRACRSKHSLPRYGRKDSRS